MVEEEFEIIPVSPLRRLEKRIERLENFSGEDPKTIFRDIMEIVKMNQQIVDQLAKSNDALRIELSKIPGKLEVLISDLKELISFIKASGDSESTITSDVMKPVVERLDALVKENKSFVERNEAMLELLDEINKKIKRSSITQQPIQPPVRPIIPVGQHSPIPNQPQMYKKN